MRAVSASLLASLPVLWGCATDDPMAPSGISAAGASTLVAAPSDLAASPVSETRIDLRWKDNSGNETRFEVERSLNGEPGPFTLWTASGANVTALTEWSAQPGIAYCYRIRAVRATGSKTTYSAFSNVSCATTPLPPPPPPPPPPDAVQSLSVSPYLSTAVWMTWSNISARFRVERSVDGGAAWHVAGTVDDDAIFYDSGLTSDQQVCYRIIAFNESGDAPPSPVDCTTPPTAPSNLVGTLRADGSIDLTWMDNSAAEDGYEVVALVTAYNHDCDAGCFDYTYEAPMGELPANATSFTCAECAGWPTWVRARKDLGTSDNSNTILVQRDQ